MNDTQMEIMPTPQRSFGLRLAALAAAGATLTMVACSDDENSTRLAGDATETTVALDSAEKEVAKELCPEGFSTKMQIKAEFDLSKVGGENALLPSFRTVEGDETTLATPEAVADTVMTLGCDHPTLLGVLDALYLQTGGFNETGRYSLPDSTLLSVIEARTELFRQNEKVALNTLENLASVVTPEGGVVYVDDFNVIAGQATLVTAERDEKGNATQIITKEVPTEGLHEGYELRFNLDDASLTAEQRATLSAISELVLITPDGDIIVNQWLGEGTTGFDIDDESQDTVPADTVIGESDDTTNLDGTKEEDGDDDGNAGEDGDGDGGSGGNEDGDCGGGCGTGGGTTTPGTNPGTNPGTSSPNTTAPTTTKPPTTTVWTTNPSTTVIVTTVAPTTTIKPKDDPSTDTTSPPPPGF